MAPTSLSNSQAAATAPRAANADILSTLPLELLLEIASHLPYPSVLSLSETSRLFHTLVSTSLPRAAKRRHLLFVTSNFRRYTWYRLCLACDTIKPSACFLRSASCTVLVDSEQRRALDRDRDQDQDQELGPLANSICVDCGLRHSKTASARGCSAATGPPSAKCACARPAGSARPCRIGRGAARAIPAPCAGGTGLPPTMGSAPSVCNGGVRRCGTTSDTVILMYMIWSAGIPRRYSSWLCGRRVGCGVAGGRSRGAGSGGRRKSSVRRCKVF